MGMTVTIEKQSDGTYIAYNTSGENVTLIGTGETVKEAKKDFMNSIDEVRSDYRKMGKSAPKCLDEDIEFSF